MALDSTAYWVLVTAVSFLKLMLIQSYRSTDFEVHRNWLAITHSLPITKWYYENTSEWTLDYPPLFAWFEYVLSQLAFYFDKNMLIVSNLNYETTSTILFQKASVVFVDLVLAYAVSRLAPAVQSVWTGTKTDDVRMMYFVLIFFNGALFIIDHIHFQYNGFMFGILVMSISRILEGKIFQGALLFSILLNMKHIYLYMAPAFGVYLFCRYCLEKDRDKIVGLSYYNLVGLGVSFLGVTAASFGPFYQHVPQILSRLFPFKRGLCHSYWAPNVWAVYSTVDVGLNFLLKKGKNTLSSGLVGEKPLLVLPQIQPIHTLILTVVFMLPCLVKIYRQPSNTSFIHGVILTSWTSYMFGYHVHEKAILNVLIPFAIIARAEPKLFFLTLVAGTASIFPLIFTPLEIILKLIIGITHVGFSWVVLPRMKFHWIEQLYLLGFFPVYILENLGDYIVPKYPFVPLMVVSNYCFVGLFICYIMFYVRCWSSNPYEERKTFFQSRGKKVD